MSASPSFLEDRLDGFDLRLVTRVGHVDEVDEQVGVRDLLERRAERREEVLGRSRMNPTVSLMTISRSRGSLRRRDDGIEGREHALLDEDLALGQDVEQGALAGVRVADDRDDRHVALAAAVAALLAARALALEHLLERLDPVAHAAAVDFELLLAGAAAADAALEARQARIAAAHQAREQVLELRQLDLDLALVRARAAREDVEDELRPVDDLDRGRLRDRARLRGREVLVDDDVIGLKARRADDQILEAAGAHQRARVELLAALDDPVDDA